MAKTDKQKKIRNKKLIKKYPWLIPRNDWTGKVIKGFDYTWHELETMGPGWWRAFGLMLCEEIQQELVKYNFVDKYRLLQVKEKYGSLRIYDNGAPGNIIRIIDKYEYISQNVCYSCGKPDIPITDAGWVLPLCEDCFKKEQWHNLDYKDVIDPEAPSKIPDSYTIRCYSGDETIDISDTVNEIRRQWQKRERKKLKARAKREAKVSGEHNSL